MPVRSPFEDLRDEHDALLTELNEIRSAVRGLSPQEANRLGQDEVVRNLLEIFRRRFRFHCRREEEALFPEAKRLISEGARGADVFGSFFASEADEDIAAHIAITSRVNEMVDLTACMEDPDSAAEAGRKLSPLANLTAALLESHVEKEDTLIFPMLENSLTDDEIDQVRSRLQEIGSARDLTPSEPDKGRLTHLGGDD